MDLRIVVFQVLLNFIRPQYLGWVDKKYFSIHLSFSSCQKHQQVKLWLPTEEKNKREMFNTFELNRAINDIKFNDIKFNRTWNDTSHWFLQDQHYLERYRKGTFLSFVHLRLVSFQVLLNFICPQYLGCVGKSTFELLELPEAAAGQTLRGCSQGQFAIIL